MPGVMFAPFDDATYNHVPDLAGVCSALLLTLISHIVADRADNAAMSCSRQMVPFPWVA